MKIYTAQSSTERERTKQLQRATCGSGTIAVVDHPSDHKQQHGNHRSTNASPIAMADNVRHSARQERRQRMRRQREVEDRDDRCEHSEDRENDGDRSHGAKA